MSLLNLSCIFSILVSRLFIYNSILFSRFWIIFTIIILNFFSGRISISSSFVWFGGHLSCSFTCEYFYVFSHCLDCCVWGCLSVFWQFVVPLYCGSSSLWVRLDIALQGFLVREACISVLVGGSVFLLSPFENNGLPFLVPGVL